MSDNFKDDTFLARWLNGDLTEEELNQFKSSEYYAQYQKIIDGAKAIVPEDFDNQEILSMIKTKLSTKEKSSGSSRRIWIYSAAASILVVIGFLIFNPATEPRLTTVASNKGEKKTIILPDGSEMTLNANSTASYYEAWDDARSITLDGEAFFKVKKGEKFTIETNSGNVSVLGTQFNVQIMNGFFEVKCFEGSVRVESGSDDEVLRPKKAYRRIHNRGTTRDIITENGPTWVKNASTFEAIPIRYVLLALENQYNVSFTGKTEFDNLTFSGTFPHDDLDVALKVVLGSLQIDYNITGGNTVTLEE